VLASSAAASTRLVVADGRLHRLPSFIRGLLTTLPPFSRPLALALLRDLRTSRLQAEDESLHSFVSRRLGPDIARWAVDPLCRGVCAGDSRQLSVHFLASYLHELEQRSLHGRLAPGWAADWLRAKVWPPTPTPEEGSPLVQRARAERWAGWGLAGGLQTLVEALASSLAARGVTVRTGAAVAGLQQAGKQVVVEMADGDSVVCDRLVLAAPAHVAAPLLRSLAPAAAAPLADIPFVSVAVTNLEYRGRDVQGGRGFGFLVPSDQPEPILGCIYDTCAFPQGDRTVLTVMAGGAWYESVVGGRGEPEVEARARGAVEGLLGIKASPVRSATSLLPRCIAQYTVGHRARVAAARGHLATTGLHISLAGSSYDGVGLNDSIVSAKQASIL
jgi:oxygen-dependent protoporphyrinogen oxidase